MTPRSCGLIFYFSFILCLRTLKKSKYLWIVVVSVSVVLVSLIFGMKTFLDDYSLPSLNRLDNTTEYFLESVRVLDVAGASVCTESNLFADLSPGLSILDIQNLYNPKHINLSAGLLSKVGVDNRINKIWINTAVHHPICFFYNKFQLTKYMLGANKGEQFLLTHDSIDENEYGYELPSSSFRDIFIFFIKGTSHIPFLRPWFIYTISFIAFIYMFWIKRLTLDYLVIFSSAIFYFVSLVMTGNAADARLPFYATSVFLILVFVSIVEFVKNRKK